MRIVSLLGIVVLSPVLAAAQSIEVFFTTGVVQLWDDEGNLGTGAPVGVGLGFRSPHGWGIEVLADAQKATRTFDSDVRLDSTVLSLRARMLKYFGDGRVQPYAGAGLGATSVKSTRDAPSGCALINNIFTCSSRDVFRSDATSGTLVGFTGIRISAGRSVFVRPEFELSKAGEHLRIGGFVAVGASW